MAVHPYERARIYRVVQDVVGEGRCQYCSHRRAKDAARVMVEMRRFCDVTPNNGKGQFSFALVGVSSAEVAVDTGGAYVAQLVSPYASLQQPISECSGSGPRW